MAIVDITKPMALDETLQGTNTKMDAVIQKLQGIIDALGLDTSVYKPKGNITCAALVPALLIDDNLGNVYNVTDNGTTTSDFVEGAGKPIHVGDNVAIVDIGTGGQSEYKFDLLAGMVDLTNYVQKSQTAGLLKNDGTVDTKDYAEKVAGATNGNLAGLNATGNPTDSGISGDMTTTSATGNPISIADLKSAQIALNPVITFEPIQAGSGTPSPSNIRAISGYDKIEVSSCGVNVWDEKWELGGLVWNTGAETTQTDRIRTGFIPVIGGATYYCYVISSITLAGFGAVYYNKLKERIDSNSGLNPNHDFTVPNDAVYMRCVFAGITTYSSGMSINYPATDTSYHAYHKTTDLSESLGQTVYGGSLDVRTGVLTVTHGIVDLGDLTYTYNAGGTGEFGASLPLSKQVSTSSNPNAVCSIYAVREGGYRQAGNFTIGVADKSYSTSPYITIKDNRYNSASDLKTALTGQKLVYELATPVEIQLTPREISLLKDYAYLSTNGTSIALDYHNGELASLSDVAQLSETVERLTEYIKGLINNA